MKRVKRETHCTPGGTDAEKYFDDQMRDVFSGIVGMGGDNDTIFAMIGRFRRKNENFRKKCAIGNEKILTLQPLRRKPKYFISTIDEKYKTVWNNCLDGVFGGLC